MALDAAWAARFTRGIFCAAHQSDSYMQEKPMARSARSRKSRPKAASGTAKARTRALRRPALSRPSRRRAGASTRADEPTRPLAFEAGDDRSGRGGDRRSFEEQQAQYPPRRVREAGLTGGEMPQRGRVTADDAAPETLL